MYGFGSQQRTGLPTKFDQFRQNIELTAIQKLDIISSHIHLRQNNLAPLNYVIDSFLTGSYKKNTMIRPPSDVDIFVLVDYGYDEITPNTMLGNLRRDLLASYPNSTVRQDKPCIVLDFNHCKFELTPAIKVYQSNDSDYYIPSQGANSWMYVENPRVLAERLTTANQGLNEMLVPLIKMMKVCKRLHNLTNLKSFEMEETAINSFGYSLGNIDSYRAGVQQLLRAYNWMDDNGLFTIENMSDQEFASYCRTTLFGNDFPA